jgi:hypothetical protein
MTAAKWRVIMLMMLPLGEILIVDSITDLFTNLIVIYLAVNEPSCPLELNRRELVYIIAMPDICHHRDPTLYPA